MVMHVDHFANMWNDGEIDLAQLKAYRKASERARRMESYKPGSMTAKKVADLAAQTNDWIYDPQEKEWYTPKEFMTKFTGYFPDNPFFEVVELRDPRDGIEAGFEQIARSQKRLKDFANKVYKYYRHKTYGSDSGTGNNRA